MSLVAPSAQSFTRQHITILDTQDAFDAGTTGRDRPEDFIEGEGLCVAFDGTGTMAVVTINGPDGQIELRGLMEIRAAAQALQHGLQLAEAFGAPIPLGEWRRIHAAP